jgi:uncharacterized protein with HEPN domain
MSKDPVEYLKHIRDECLFLRSKIGPDLSRSEFLGDETLKRAVVRSLENIGEATKNIPADFKVNYDTIKWKEMAGMRDRLIHDYMGVNYTIVWDVISSKIPDLLHQVNQVINTKEK